MKKYCFRFVLLFLIMLGASVYGGNAKAGDAFKDLPNRNAIIQEATNWNLEQSTRLDAVLDCGGKQYRVDSAENMIIDVVAEAGTTAQLSEALFNCVKNGRAVIVDRNALPYCEMYVPSNSNASLVNIDGMNIHFEGGGEVAVIVKYEHVNLLGLSMNVSALLVRFNFTVEEKAEAAMELYDSISGGKIETLHRTFGSFSWDGASDSNDRSLKLEFSVPENDQSILISNAQLTLPDGFSFEKEKLINTKKLPLNRIDSATLSGKITVYPIYSEAERCQLKYEYEGEAGTIDFEIDTPSAKGLIKMRPTSNVNLVDAAPFCLTVDLKPVEDFIEGSSERYSANLATLGCTLSQAVYNKNYHENEGYGYIDDSLKNLGFSQIRHLGSIDDHDVAASLAVKKVVHDEEIYHVVMVVVRGTVATEWIGNFNISGSDNSVHTDFAMCAKNLKQRVTDYINKVLKISTENLKIYLCGHSRAGAVVDLVAHDFNGIYGKENVFAYTYAAPNSTKNPVADGNIFNYVYKYDLVGFVPQGGYGKHGVTLVVGGEKVNSAPVSVKEAFKSYTNGTEFKGVGSAAAIRSLIAMKEGPNGLISKHQKFIGTSFSKPTKIGTNMTMWLSKGHGAENYCAWVINNGVSGAQTMSSCLADYYGYVDNSELKSRVELGRNAGYVVSQMAEMAYPEGFAIVGAGCPVDIDVYDADGTLTAQFRGHEEIIENEDFVAFGDGEASYFAFAKGTDYSVIITGTGDGKMNYDYAFIDEEGKAAATDTIAGVRIAEGEVLHLTGSASDLYTPVLIAGNGMAITSGSVGRTIYLPEDTVRIEAEAFRNTAAHTIIIPASCMFVGERAFADSESLQQIVFENSGYADLHESMIDGSENAVIVAPEGSDAEKWAQARESGLAAGDQ